ncbi:MAG: VWA domain-containing protein [Pirellulaceae bacterium]|nr:VWA domain-containing protein [Pirellulaceae bacterium]
MDIQYGNLAHLNWLWLIAICIAVCVLAVALTRRARTRFATSNLLPRFLPPSNERRLIVSTLLVSMSLALMTIALVDIRWGKVWREVPQKGIEVMFVLDVSRSMLAEDVHPNRLERAKQQIKDTLDEMAGDRVGLIVFAGDTRQLIPLTSHYDDFKQGLESVGTYSIRRGGSRLGEAIETAANGFLSKTNDHKAMIVLTDGEDQESRPIDAAKKAYADHGIRIFTIGLGDDLRGARIPDRSETDGRYVQHEGEQVWSKMDGEVLGQIAASSNGAYIPAGTKYVDMADVYHRYIADVPPQEFDTAKIHAYEARFQWVLAVALILLIIEIWWSNRNQSLAVEANAVGIVRQDVNSSSPQDEQRNAA